MEDCAKIMIVDDDNVIQDIMATVFEKEQVVHALTGEIGLELATKFLPDLIVLDINMPGMDGYETCKHLRNNELFKQTPILFLSQYQGLEDRLKAYGAGGDDYISKPVDNAELSIKAKHLIESNKQRMQLKEELKTSFNVVMEVQKYASNLQVIGRFLMANLFCHDLNDLAELFIKTVKELEISCILSLNSEFGSILCSDTGSINKLEGEILGMSEQMERIHPFGKNRSLFNWKNIAVLVRNIDDNADIMAILMDGLESGVKAIEKERKLLNSVSELEEKNQKIEYAISQQFNEMKYSLAETFLSLGMVSSLEPEEEDRLNHCVEIHHNQINLQLAKLNANNKKLADSINQLRNSNDKSKSDTAADTSAESISFF